MTDDKDLLQWHKNQAVECFNKTWDLIDKADRTAENDNAMIHLAHASRYHWGRVGTALEWARGEWQISRVYALLSMGESALYHAAYSLNLCQDNGIGDFDLAFAYEAVARANKVLKHVDQVEKFVELAKAACEGISDEADRKYVFAEISSI